jgi:hypothetical protein
VLVLDVDWLLGVLAAREGRKPYGARFDAESAC